MFLDYYTDVYAIQATALEVLALNSLQKMAVPQKSGPLESLLMTVLVPAPQLCACPLPELQLVQASAPPRHSGEAEGLWMKCLQLHQLDSQGYKQMPVA